MLTILNYNENTKKKIGPITGFVFFIFIDNFDKLSKFLKEIKNIIYLNKKLIDFKNVKKKN